MRLHAGEKMPALSWLTLIHAMLGVTALGSGANIGAGTSQCEPMKSLDSRRTTVLYTGMCAKEAHGHTAEA